MACAANQGVVVCGREVYRQGCAYIRQLANNACLEITCAAPRRERSVEIKRLSTNERDKNAPSTSVVQFPAPVKMSVVETAQSSCVGQDSCVCVMCVVMT